MKRQTGSKFCIMISILILFNFASAQTKDQKIATDEFVSQAEKRFELSKRDLTLERRLENGNTIIEKFSYSQNKDGRVETLKVSFRKGIVLYEEEFYYKNGQLLFVTERETATKDGEIIHEWSGVYYLDNGRLFDLITNGHGKSEDDSWKPELEIPLLSELRSKDLKNYIESTKGKGKSTGASEFPEKIRLYLDKNYPDWKLAASCRTGQVAPVRGYFDGDKKEDLALVITAKDGKDHFLAFLKRKDDFQAFLLKSGRSEHSQTAKESAGFLLEIIKKGEVLHTSHAAEFDGPVTLKNEGIQFQDCKFSEESGVYYFENDKFEYLPFLT